MILLVREINEVGLSVLGAVLLLLLLPQIAMMSEVGVGQPQSSRHPRVLSFSKVPWHAYNLECSYPSPSFPSFH